MAIHSFTINNQTLKLDDAAITAIYGLTRKFYNPRAVQAIKLIRTLCNCGLMEAKCLYDFLRDNMFLEEQGTTNERVRIAPPMRTVGYLGESV